MIAVAALDAKHSTSQKAVSQWQVYRDQGQKVLYWAGRFYGTLDSLRAMWDGVPIAAWARMYGNG